VIPNVKSNHVEKTMHPCQFPVVGTTLIAAIRHGRKGIGAEIVPEYIEIAYNRIKEEISGTLRTRSMGQPVYDPVKAGNSLITSPWNSEKLSKQRKLLEKRNIKYGNQ
jgi:adenine-specific DNA-methyltransferase